jgi:hypothetical protein
MVGLKLDSSSFHTWVCSFLLQLKFGTAKKYVFLMMEKVPMLRSFGRMDGSLADQQAGRAIVVRTTTRCWWSTIAFSTSA